MFFSIATMSAKSTMPTKSSKSVSPVDLPPAKAAGESTSVKSWSLEDQLTHFRQSKFLAMPIAGMIAWAGIAVAAYFLETDFARSMAIYAGTGVIFYLGLLVAKITGEDLLGREKPQPNFFDRLFLATVFQAVLVYSIAIPFALVQPDSLPLSVGILTGLMWVPFSVMLGHWVGIFHTVSRTAAILVLWYAFPDWRYCSIPLAIVAVYLVTILVLIGRPRPTTSLSTPA